MAYDNFIVLDVETNGVDPTADSIIEFAAVQLDAQGAVIDTLDLLISTSSALTPTVIDITGITSEMLAGAPTFDAVRATIKEFIGSSPIVGHSVSIDVDFLNGHGCELTNDILDTFELASTILPAQEAYSLEYLSHHYQFPHKPSHRAMADVMATVDLARFLVSLPTLYPEAVRARINTLIPGGLWNWAWIFETNTWAPVDHVAGSYSLQTQTLLTDLVEAREYLPQIEAAIKGGANFIEYHHPVDPLALNLVYAVSSRPSILLVNPKQLKDIDWTAVGRELDVPIVIQTGTNLRYREGSLEESAARPDLVTSTLARLMVKIILWSELWGRDYNQLHLSSDEFRLWEARFNDASKSGPAKTPKNSLVVTLTQHLLNLEVDPSSHIVIPSPLMVETQTLKSQIKTLSGYYFNWVVSSRRDFLHTVVKAEDVKLSDALFKTLNHVGTLFTDLEHNMIALYHNNPPANLLDREIELTPEHIDDEIKTVIHALVTELTAYIEGLNKLDSQVVESHIADTYKLVDHLTALQLVQPSYRYMLYADGSRFFLDLVPERPDFSQLTEKLTTAASFTAISPGLTFGRTFDYFTKSWPTFKGVVLEDKDNLTEILMVEDVKSPHSTDYLIDLLHNRPGRHLIMLSSGYEAHSYFEKYFDVTLKESIQAGSCELLGKYKGLSEIAGSTLRTYSLFSAYSCLDKIKRDLSALDELFIFKLPADRSSGMKYGTMVDAADESKLDSLSRQTLRVKEVLHDLARSRKPIILADPWLNTPGGKKVVKSLRGFMVIPVDQKEVI